MPLFAAEAAADATTTVVFGLTAVVALMGGLFGMAVAVKQLFFRPVNPGNEYVTRAELDKTVTNLDNKIDSLRNELSSQIKDLQKYMTDSNHRLTDFMQNLSIKLTALTVTNEVVLGIKTPRAPNAAPEAA